MKAHGLLVCLLFLFGAMPGNAQSGPGTLDLEAVGEFRTTSVESQEAGAELAVVVARRNILKDAADRLRNFEEIKAARLKPGQIEAILPALLDIQKAGVQSTPQGSATSHKATVTVHLEVPRIARRLEKIRQDPNAVTGLIEVSRRAEALYSLLTTASNRKDQSLLAIRFRANRGMAQAYGAIAKTQESPASRRISSRAGRQRAMQLAEAALTLEPDLPEAHLLMGDVLADLDQAPAAEVAYRKAMSLDPTSSRTHVKLADALRREEKVPEAITALREALRLDPNSAIAHNDLGFAFESQQNIADSMASYREAIRLDPDLVEPHNYLAIALARQGKIPEAVDEFVKIIRIDPESVLGYYNMAIALADMEKDDESAEAFRYALHFNPYHYNAHYNVGELFRLEGKLDEAVTQFQTYLRMAPVTPQTQRNIQRASEFVRTHENP